jgi:chromosome partitioning protein
MDVYTFANKKGGVTKTTSSVNIAAAFGMMGKKVLFIDLDPQANSTSTLIRGRTRQEVRHITPSIYEVLKSSSKDLAITTAIRKTREDNVDIIPSSERMGLAEIELSMVIDSNRLLLHRLPEIEGLAYDVVVIDTPPVLTLLKLIALFASNKVIIPTTPSEYATDGIEGIIEELGAVQERAHKDIAVKILYARVDNTKITETVRDELKQAFNGYVFYTEIPEATIMQRAERAAQSILRYAPKSAPAVAYAELMKEVIAL